MSPQGREGWRQEFGRSFEGLRVLVTGAAGFIGSHLMEALAALGAEVRGVSREAGKGGIDLTDYEAARRSTGEFGPDLIYHLAAKVTGGQEISLVLPTLRDNLVTTVHMLTAAHETTRARFVWLGTSDEARIASPYAASKSAARTYVELFRDIYGLPTVLVRPYTVYGPRQPVDKLIPYSILSFLRGEPPRLTSGTQIRDFVYVLDVVRGLLAAGASDEAIGQDLDLGSGTGRPTKDVIALLQTLTGARVEAQFGVVPNRVGEGTRAADTEKAAALLGWAPRWSLEDGLKETIAWYSSEHRPES